MGKQQSRCEACWQIMEEVQTEGLGQTRTHALVSRES